jgi:hypothetical protein
VKGGEKMTYTKYQSERNEVWEKKVGESLEGLYVNKRIVTTESGDSTLYTIETKNGKRVDLWGTKIIDDFFKNMVIGTDVQIKYLGKEKTEKGGRTYHNFELGWDKETAPRVDNLEDIAKQVVNK